MADNVAISAGVGTSVATDQVGSDHYQRVKVTWGADGVANDANATTPLPVATASANSAVGDGVKQVTTAGTRVTLAASTACKQVIVTALSTNSGVIVVGGSTCVAAAGTQASPTRRGTPLLNGDSVVVEISNLSLIYLDSTVNNDGVAYAYFN